MKIFGREPTIGNSNLTESDLARLLDLDDTYRTDYTYVTTRSYRLNGSDDYETPRMSRLPLKYYRRKWAFEKAREAGLLYYIYFCTCDFVNELIPRPLTRIFNTIIHYFWHIINGIFPNPEHFTVRPEMQVGSAPSLEEYDRNASEIKKLKKLENNSQLSSISRETVRHNQMTSSDSFATKLGRSFANMVKLSYFSGGDVQSRSGVRQKHKNLGHTDDHTVHEGREHSSFNSVSGSTRSVQRRVRTSSYEYSEDRGSEVNSQSVRTATPSKGFVESLLFILFYYKFMILLLPLKIFELAIGRIASILPGLSYPIYDLRSRTVYKNLTVEETLPYTNRFVNFLSGIATSCSLSIVSLIGKVVSLPLIFFSGINRLFGSHRSGQFGPEAAPLVNDGGVKPSKRKGLAASGPAAKSREEMINATAYKKRKFATRSVVKRPSAFCMWLFPLLILLLLFIVFHERYVDHFDLIMGGIPQNLFDGWKEKVEHGLNLMRTKASYVLTSVYYFLHNLLLYIAKLWGSIMPPRDAVERIVQLPKYVYMTGHLLDMKAMVSTYKDNKILNDLYNFGELAAVGFFERVSILGSSFCDAVRKICTIPEWITTDYISDNILDAIVFIWKLIESLVQILLALPSYFIAIISQLTLYVHEKANGVINSKDFNMKQNDWNLEHLKHEKELLELEVLQLRRERELKENRRSSMHEASRIVQKPSIDELSQHNNNQEFLNYMANLRKQDDEEMEKHFLAIEKRLMERLDTLSIKIENEIVQKISHTNEQSDLVRSALSNELSELSSAVGNLRTQFDELRREKKMKIAPLDDSMISGDIKKSDDLSILKTELNKKIKDELDKKLALSLNRFEKASHEGRETFRLEIMKAVEKQLVDLFASHVTKRNATISETKLNSALGLSESDFTVIKNMITDALDMYDADKTGKVDYALESSGASIVSTRCTEPYQENSRLESIFGIPLWYSSYSPRAVIQHRSLAAGECWAFRGKGYLTIKLSHPIYVTEVSYEHLHSTLHPDGVLRSAPKLFQVYSYKAVDDLTSKSLIGEYEYDIKGRALQTFRVQKEPNTPVSIVELVVQSNWDSDYTCLYRFRVHGQKAK